MIKGFASLPATWFLAPRKTRESMTSCWDWTTSLQTHNRKTWGERDDINIKYEENLTCLPTSKLLSGNFYGQNIW